MGCMTSVNDDKTNRRSVQKPSSTEICGYNEQNKNKKTTLKPQSKDHQKRVKIGFLLFNNSCFKIKYQLSQLNSNDLSKNISNNQKSVHKGLVQKKVNSLQNIYQQSQFQINPYQVSYNCTGQIKLNQTNLIIIAQNNQRKKVLLYDKKIISPSDYQLEITQKLKIKYLNLQDLQMLEKLKSVQKEGSSLRRTNADTYENNKVYSENQIKQQQAKITKQNNINFEQTQQKGDKTKIISLYQPSKGNMLSSRQQKQSNININQDVQIKKSGKDKQTINLNLKETQSGIKKVQIKKLS